MILQPSHLKTLCEAAIDAARKAGAYINSQSRYTQTVQHKGGTHNLAAQVFTEVDLASEKIILDCLKPSLKDFDLALLSEETKDDGSRFEKDYFWCIDPLDGSLPFIEHSDGYSISIALISKAGIPHIGVIYNPVDNTLYHAIKGHGAFRNHTLWQLHPKNSMTLVCDRSFLNHPRYEEVVSKIKARSQGELKIISHGGAAMNAMWVLEGHPAVYFKFPKAEEGGGSLWDYGASACIFHEIKAHVSDAHGQPLALNNPLTTFMHQGGICYASTPEIQAITQLLIK
ncbi:MULTISPECIES: 3'(2'),5'-bisphosphate nucleotidase CysQ family protein [unclassified Carboxylicivirga]|uniref:3'(2'),5'-bisphosphate nucleotidase CysQ family protein n=1 Tax=Carboxylicivirga TaxID=1628153 RepID=UPI003D32E1DE